MEPEFKWHCTPWLFSICLEQRQKGAPRRAFLCQLKQDFPTGTDTVQRKGMSCVAPFIYLWHVRLAELRGSIPGRISRVGLGETPAGELAEFLPTTAGNPKVDPKPQALHMEDKVWHTTLMAYAFANPMPTQSWATTISIGLGVGNCVCSAVLFLSLHFQYCLCLCKNVFNWTLADTQTASNGHSTPQIVANRHFARSPGQVKKQTARSR